MKRILPGLALIALTAGGVLHAQDTTGPQVARIAYVHGDATLFANGAGPWEPARINRPLAQGERLVTKGSSLAEIDLGGSVLRLGGTSELGVSSLSPTQARFALPSGVLQISVRTLNPGQTLEVDTDKVAVLIDQPGRYRLEAGKAYTRVNVRDGSASAYGKQAGPLALKAGQNYRFDNSSLTALAVSGLPVADAFDRWAQARDGAFVAPATTQYVSSDTVGYQDLDRYGTWQEDQQDGAVWYPNDVADDWQPYDSGSWDYVDPWGWTYVGAEPWGFAPFHYGSWTHRHGRWGWVPGRRRLHDPGYQAAQVPPPAGHQRPGQAWSAATPPPSSFPEVRRFQQQAAQPNRVGTGVPLPHQDHNGWPRDSRLLRVPDRNAPTVVANAPRPNGGFNASTRPGLSFIAPDPAQVRQARQAEEQRVVSTQDTPQQPGFVPTQRGEQVHTYRGDLGNGARPEVRYMSRPIDPTGGNHGGWHRPPPGQAPPPGNQGGMAVSPRPGQAPPANHGNAGGNGNASHEGRSGLGTVR